MENYIPMAITILVIYLLMNVGVGLYGMRKIKSAESYYTSGHAMGPWAVALAFGATCYSATLIIGFGGKAYDVGASLMWGRCIKPSFHDLSGLGPPW